ncbi:MAG: HAMP domain-containing histidine kinase [Kamptonema sp. SIO4C4]|nr:HAMP domain-containing histidine kinase [Kamptonema sp. SIO4C4]
MNGLAWLQNIWHQGKQRFNPHSLQFQLTVGIALVSAVGISSLTAVIAWQLDRLIVTSHKRQVASLAKRVMETVEIYSQMMPTPAAMEKAIAHLTTGDILIWIESPDGEVVAMSEALAMGNWERKVLEIADQGVSPTPQMYAINQGYWLLCGNTLEIQQQDWGTVYLAYDMTGDQRMFYRLIGMLGGVSVVAIGGMTIAIAYYIQTALKPLQQMRQQTAALSAEQLGKEALALTNAPSELHQLETAFNQMLKRFHESWEQQRQFVSNVSHELRTPLTLVCGYLQSTLRRGQNLSEPQQEALSIAASEAKRTVQMLEDLLELARAENRHLHFRQEPLLLNDFVVEVVDMAKQYSQRTIEFKPEQSLVEVIADRDRLKQVLLNLIDNAVKYSEPEQPITIIVEQDSNRGIIKVCDRGFGIPLAQQSRIFERFYRLDDARCRTTGGIGLGLSLVQTLVAGMDGTVSVRSQLGEGSTFIVTLPSLDS